MLRTSAPHRRSHVVSLVLLGVLVAAPVSGQDWTPLPDRVTAPEANPTTPEKVELGKKLYFDPRISKAGTVSCNTCHNVMEGGDDGRPSSMGIHGLLGPRNAPTVWNSAFQGSQFWDGRAATLEEQAKGPIIAAPEMGMASHDEAIERIRAIPGYVREFRQVFGGDDPVTLENAVRAIAAFERTLITPNSPYDRHARGETKALTEQQVGGLEIFRDYGCLDCHSGPAFNGPQWDRPAGPGSYRVFPGDADHPSVAQFRLDQDLGRYAVTGEERDRHRFKVPTLRNVELTAPYFHNGAVPTLEEAVRVMAATQLGLDLLDEEVAEIVAFLGALTGEFPEITLPRLPSRPGRPELGEQEPATFVGHPH